jgi:hypothetical protein
MWAVLHRYQNFTHALGPTGDDRPAMQVIRRRYVARLEGGPLDGLAFSVAGVAPLIELQAPPPRERPASAGLVFPVRARSVAIYDLASAGSGERMPGYAVLHYVYATSRPIAPPAHA